jgi:hypothetical protein
MRYNLENYNLNSQMLVLNGNRLDGVDYEALVWGKRDFYYR